MQLDMLFSAKTRKAVPHKPLRLRFLRRVVVIAVIVCCSVSGAFISLCHAEDASVAARRSSDRLSFSDSEIAEGFFAVAFVLSCSSVIA